MTTPYLLTLSAKADSARLAPYLDRLAQTYATVSLAFPIIDPLADGVIDKVENATAAVFFVSKDSVGDSLLRAAIDRMLFSDKPILVVYLDEIALPAGLQFQLSLCPVFYPNRHTTTDSAAETLATAPYLQKAFGV